MYFLTNYEILIFEKKQRMNKMIHGIPERDAS